MRSDILRRGGEGEGRDRDRGKTRGERRDGEGKRSDGDSKHYLNLHTVCRHEADGRYVMSAWICM